MREKRVWARLLGVEQAVIESVEIDDGKQVVVVGPTSPGVRSLRRLWPSLPGLRPGRGPPALAGA